MPILTTTCAECGQRFPSYVGRVPGARAGTTRYGPAKDMCGVCRPIDDGIDWAAAAVGRRVIVEEDGADG